MEQKTFGEKVWSFIKRFYYYILIGAAAIALIITISVIGVQNKGNVDEKIPTGNVPVSMLSPVSNGTVLKDFSDKKLMYNSTLNQWEAHKCIDLKVDMGTEVVSCLDGVIKQIYTNYLEGTVVVIEHENDLTTVYGSLDEKVLVKEGDKVKRGDVIGKASNSAHAEKDLGAHVHFSVIENNQKVDPKNYISFDVK